MQGSGEAVTQALLGLAKLALESSRFTFQQPVIPEDDEDDDGEEGDNMEGNQEITDMAEMNVEVSDDDDIAELVE